MTYREVLRNVDTEKALALLKIASEQNGAYLKFKCPEKKCNGTASIKASGDKKNLYYCTKCRLGGHIIALTMKVKGLDQIPAKQYQEDNRRN